MKVYHTSTGMPYAFKRHLIGNDIGLLTKAGSPTAMMKATAQVLSDTLAYLGEDGYVPTARDLEILLRTDLRLMLYTLIRDHEYGDIKEFLIKEQEVQGLDSDLTITLPALGEEVEHTSGGTTVFPVVAVPKDDVGNDIKVSTFAEWRTYARNRVCGEYELTPLLANTNIVIRSTSTILDVISPCKVMRRQQAPNGDTVYVSVDLAQIPGRDLSKLYNFVMAISGKIDTTIKLTEEDGVPQPTTVDVMALESFYMPSFPV